MACPARPLHVHSREKNKPPTISTKKQSFDDKKNYIEDVTDADFYKCVEINGTLPGASQLEVGPERLSGLSSPPNRCGQMGCMCVSPS